MALRFADLGRRSLWYDEAWAALGCLDGPLDIAHVRATPYLFAGLVRGAVGLFGRTEFAVRLPAAVFSVASVALGYVVGRRALGELGGIVMALLLGWLPIPVAYGKELKHYAAEVLLALVVAWSVQRAGERPRSIATWVVLALVVVVGSGVTALAPLLAAAGFVVLLPTARRAPVHYTLAAVASGLAALAWLTRVFLPQRALETNIEQYWSLFFLPHGSPAVVAIAALRSAIDASTFALVNWTPHLADNLVRIPLVPRLPTIGLVGVMILGAGVLVVRGEGRLVALAALWHILVATAAFARAYPYGPARIALVFVVPTSMLLSAAVVGVVEGVPRAVRPLVLALCLLPLVWPLAGSWRENVAQPFEYEELGPVIGDLIAHAQPGDAIWVSTGAAFAFRFYVPEPDARVSFSPHPTLANEYRASLLDALRRGNGRAWLVFSHRQAVEIPLARQALGQVSLVEEYTRKNASALLVVRPPGRAPS